MCFKNASSFCFVPLIIISVACMVSYCVGHLAMVREERESVRRKMEWRRESNEERRRGHTLRNSQM